MSASGKAAAEGLLRALFMVGEALLTDPVKGTTSFAAEFAAAGRRDRRGRSLRDLDLDSRLFRHRLSYMIYDDSLRQAPAVLLNYLFARLRDVLDGKDTGPAFKALSEEERTAVREILRDTKPEVFTQ